MPVSTIKVIEGVFLKEQKVQLIEKVKEAMIEVEGEEMRHHSGSLLRKLKEGIGLLEERSQLLNLQERK